MLTDCQKAFVEEYRNKKHLLYHDFAKSIKDILSQIIHNYPDLKCQYISYREKDPDKLYEKIERKNREEKEYKLLGDCPDLAGVRVIFYLESNKENFIKVLREEFKDGIGSIKEKYNPEGYRATHIILKLDRARLQHLEHRRFQDLKCEIQVTSALFHVWSEIEHDFIYKPKVYDKDKLKELGLDDLRMKFEKTMQEHIQQATVKFDIMARDFENLTKAKQFFEPNYIISLDDNDAIFSALEIIENFAYRKPEE